MKRNFMLMAVAVVMAVAFAACSKDDGPNLTPQEEITLKANKFVYDYTSEAYLWEEFIPDGINYKTAAGPVELFEQMKYKKLDKWSYVSSESDEVMDSFQGVSTTYGYSLAFGRFSNSPTDYFAVIEYVYADSPAQKAGLKRGDIILEIDGKGITEENYLNLYYSSSAELSMGVLTAIGTIAHSGTKVQVKAVKMYEDPVIEAKVLDIGGKKIGYLCYVAYYEESHEKLVEVFSNFKQQNVSELILDLRYNPGGNAVSPPFLASLFAPQGAVKGGHIFLTETWNDLYMRYFKQEGYDMNAYFYKDIPVNLNLSKVYVLTTANTASASEATISGLMPYMDVIKIGSTTHGKYCGAALLSPTDSDGNPDPQIGNWLLSLVVYKFVNTEGYTEFGDGISPDWEVEDTGLLNGIPLGDISDPLVAKAVSLITGVQTEAASPLSIVKDVEMLPHMSERPFRGGYTTVGINIF